MMDLRVIKADDDASRFKISDAFGPSCRDLLSRLGLRFSFQGLVFRGVGFGFRV